MEPLGAGIVLRGFVEGLVEAVPDCDKAQPSCIEVKSVATGKRPPDLAVVRSGVDNSVQEPLRYRKLTGPY